MPANKYALLRYRIIDKRISNKYKPYPNKENLREACEEALYGATSGDNISNSTIDKDLWAMRNENELGFFAPIQYSKLHKGYYYEDPDYTIDNIPLNDIDVEAIKFAANTLYQFKGIDLFKQYESAIEKILDRLNISPSVTDKAVEEFVQFETAPAYLGSQFLGELLHSIRDRVVVNFDYSKFSGGKSKKHELHPYLLKEYRNRWYIIGYSKEKETEVVFALDRMANLELTSETFQRSLDFKPDNYFKHSIGITTNTGDPENITLRFSPLAGKYISSQPIHESQKILRNDEVAFEISLFLNITKELIMLILSYGDDVEVKAPDHLRSRIKTILERSTAKY